MIRLTRLNGRQLLVNALLIESIEETPDTIITLITGKKITVLEPMTDVVQLVTQYMQTIGSIAGTIKSIDSEGS
ncbi:MULTISPECIES: flagellar FlbD family protein [Paenibacillus]|jgi:flagellar protein FlbD|uniref:Flagellar FlbD family protein n=1 Tax=Paenibacillus baimaensis TaxID=2982185 RepID=A0ABT2UL13_9BACL|nr:MULTISPECIES: flagellar FlbD family protein [unclassified Paenibacillus]MCU6795340.1 flagellar FlbD family protein [Paenibacillus sp. WQ 127069]OMF14613.1 flagellar protein D [Paenibacillus sp. FSL H7-0331]